MRLLEKLGAHFSFLVKFFGLELNVDEVGVFEEPRKLVQFVFLEDLQLLVKRVEEVNDALAKLVFQVELFALRDLLSAQNQVARSFLDVLEEVLRGGFQQQDLVVVVPMVGQVAALFADELIVQGAVSYVVAAVVRTQSHLPARS